MKNYNLFLVICLTSLLYSTDCSSLNELSSTPPVENASSTKNETITSIPLSASNVTDNNVTTSTTEEPSVKTTNSSTTKPTSTSSTTVKPTSTSSTTSKPTSTSSTTSKPTPTPTTSKPTPTPTTSSPSSTTTEAPNKHDRSFDLPSFIGGVILSLGLAAIGYVVYKFYKTRTDPNYRSL